MFFPPSLFFFRKENNHTNRGSEEKKSGKKNRKLIENVSKSFTAKVSRRKLVIIYCSNELKNFCNALKKKIVRIKYLENFNFTR